MRSYARAENRTKDANLDPSRLSIFGTRRRDCDRRERRFSFLRRGYNSGLTVATFSTFFPRPYRRLLAAAACETRKRYVIPCIGGALKQTRRFSDRRKEFTVRGIKAQIRARGALTESEGGIEKFGPCPAEHDNDYVFHMTFAIGGASFEIRLPQSHWL